MKHKLYFSGAVIDLDQQIADVENSFKAVLGKWYPTVNVEFGYYMELDDKTIEFCIKRNYRIQTGMSGIDGCIGSNDMEIISSIPEYAFRPEKEPGVHLIPWYDGNYYTPTTEFVQIWAHFNDVKANEPIDKIKIEPVNDELKISVVFK